MPSEKISTTDDLTWKRMQTVAKRILEENIDATADETLVVITDEPKREVGQAIFAAGQERGLDAGLLEMTSRNRSGEEPPAYVRAAMEASDIAVCPTSTSLTHTRAREHAVEAGTRVATMPGITTAMFEEGAMTADYQRVEALTIAVTEALTNATIARIEANGERFSVSLDGRDGIPSSGILRQKGASGNLPSGEGYIAPMEGTAEGTLVFDGGIVGSGEEDSLSVNVESGYITDVAGEYADEFLDRIADDSCARRVCELGIGTNPSASIIGTVLEDEKVYGTAHIAFGDNYGFGGEIECQSHIDGIITQPDVFLDDELIISEGEIRINC